MKAIRNKKIVTYPIEDKGSGPEHFYILKTDIGFEYPSVYDGPHSHHYYCISFLFEGCTEHSSDMKTIKVCAPAIMLLDIDQVHIHHSIKGCKIIHICFSPDFIKENSAVFLQKLEQLFTVPVIPISSLQLAELDPFIQLILQQYHKDRCKDSIIIRHLLDIVLILCLNYSPAEALPENRNKKKDIYHCFKDLLNSRYKTDHQVNSYARQLGISNEKLNEIVKTCSSKTPKQLIDERLVKEARRLLYWSNLNMKEITWILGFETQSYFIRFFKKHTGITPGQFQKQKT